LVENAGDESDGDGGGGWRNHSPWNLLLQDYSFLQEQVYRVIYVSEGLS